MEHTEETTARVLARSPGQYPILVAELEPTNPGEPGGLRVLYHEAGYDPNLSKPVTHEWLRDNAIGRHSFVPVDPPQEMPVSALQAFVNEAPKGA